MGDILDVTFSAATICHWKGQGNISPSSQSGHLVRYFLSPHRWTCSVSKTNADTHCQHTAHTPSGAAQGWAQPCVCHLEDTPPQTEFHQSAERLKMRQPIAAGKRWSPSLQPNPSLQEYQEFSTLDSGRLVLKPHCKTTQTKYNTVRNPI